VIQVPPNTKHAIRNVEQDLLIYNVFAPAMKYMKGGK
jgi:quercetin dioxygenase-like cupin family protein